MQAERFDFLKKKYGKELLVDLARVESLKNYVLDKDLHFITFYEVLIITEGAGNYFLDEHQAPVGPGTVIVTLPNQIRQWKIEKPVKGFSFFFEGEFLNSYFRDDLFLNRFSIFDYSRPFTFVRMEEEKFIKLVSLLEEAEKEFIALKGDSSHIFRALLYYIISVIDRNYREQHQIEKLDIHPVIYRMKKLLDRHVHTWHTVAEYASALGVSHNHLNTLCKKHLSKTALRLVHERILLEARRELRFSGLSVSEIAYTLGFSDVSNFNRFFKKLTGSSPRGYRAEINQ